MGAGQGVTRRRFLLGMLSALGGAVLAGLRRIIGRAAPDGPADVVPRIYLPVIVRNYPPPEASRVVHVHDPDATSWNFSTGWYGDYVNQSVVDRMVEEGLKTLTGTGSVQDAWRKLLPDYQPGQKIAIKVNFNNTTSCDDRDGQIDALIEPVNALIGSMVNVGIQEEDIWVFEASRRIPSRFYGRRRYTAARYIDYYQYGEGCADAEATFDHVDESLRVSFAHPALSDRWLSDVLFQATYLINMPIMKYHGIHPVTLGFKNHFGCLDNIIRQGDDSLHWYIAPSDGRYRPDYSPLVDIYINPNIAGKTVLIVGDGLFGSKAGTTQPPSPWNTFGGAPNSLFFSRDPVAVDCVMADFIRIEREGAGMEGAYDYLFCAQEAGLGTCEGSRDDPGGDPWQTPYGSGYSGIEYVRVEL